LGLAVGAIGLVLAIPITAAVKAVCDNVDSLKPYGDWMGEASLHLAGIKAVATIFDHTLKPARARRDFWLNSSESGGDAVKLPSSLRRGPGGGGG